MFRSLHIKLVLILLLLITSLMAVVGAFLTAGVSSYYIDSFYQLMDDNFGEGNADFMKSLSSAAAQSDSQDRIKGLQDIMDASVGKLGIDYRTRNYYILDGESGAVLYGSDEAGGKSLVSTPNLLAARNGEPGDKSDITASYMTQKPTTIRMMPVSR